MEDLCGHCGQLWEKCKGACIEAVGKHRPYIVVIDSMNSVYERILREFIVPLEYKDKTKCRK